MRIRPVNLEQMTERADRIFHGRCLEVRSGIDPNLGQTVTYVTFAADRGMKGLPRGGRLTIKMLGNVSSSAQRGEETEGLPRFEAGEEVVLFLHPESPLGLTSPVGLGQGKFGVQRDTRGRAVLTNGFGNQKLWDGLSAKAYGKLGARVERFKGPEPIPLGDFLEMTQSLLQSN